jgi:hypothetical protein
VDYRDGQVGRSAWEASRFAYAQHNQIGMNPFGNLQNLFGGRTLLDQALRFAPGPGLFWNQGL